MHSKLTSICATAALGAAAALAPAAQAAHPARAAAAKTVLIGCLGKSDGAAPAAYNLACGDANTFLSGMKWEGWGTRNAHATGKYVYNTCTPNCAAGHSKSIAVVVTATKRAQHGSVFAYGSLLITGIGGAKINGKHTITVPVGSMGPFS